MPNWTQHGEFQYRWYTNVLIVTYTGTWNDQAVTALQQALAPSIEARHGGPWAMLTNASCWEGGTPEVFTMWWQFFKGCVNKGLVVATDLLPPDFHPLLIHFLAERASQMVNYRQSSSMQDAANWLAEQGYPIQDAPH